MHFIHIAMGYNIFVNDGHWKDTKTSILSASSNTNSSILAVEMIEVQIDPQYCYCCLIFSYWYRTIIPCQRLQYLGLEEGIWFQQSMCDVCDWKGIWRYYVAWCWLYLVYVVTLLRERFLSKQLHCNRLIADRRQTWTLVLCVNR